MNKLKAVIDTNVLIKSVKRSNSEFAIYQAFSAERFDWVISTGILNEYEEKLVEFYSAKTAQLIVEVLCTAPNVIFAEPHFQWNIIDQDPDDNKFADLGISAGADCLVTFDRHFNIFHDLDFPKLRIVRPEDFVTLLSSHT